MGTLIPPRQHQEIAYSSHALKTNPRRCTASPMDDVCTPAQPFRVAALYRFVRLDRCEELRASLAAFCCGRGIKGTLLIAREGINGTVAGSEAAIADLIAHLEAMPEFAGLDVKYSAAGEMPFRRMKVRLK